MNILIMIFSHHKFWRVRYSAVLYSLYTRQRMIQCNIEYFKDFLELPIAQFSQKP